MKNSVLLLIIFFVILGCKQKAGSSKPVAQAEDTTHFFQVSQYIKQQIEDVKKTPYYIYRIDIKNGIKDSMPINTPKFTQLASRFTTVDINDPKHKRDYIENIFHDQTTKTFTISYTTLNKDLEIQNIEILLQEDGQTVKRIFIRKFLNYSDNSVIEQLSWKAAESFQINRLVQTKNEKENSQQTMVVWNEKS
ncbi:MAG: hypothetical protein H0X70_02645 [Segetibacter sp.]|jgi:hypothetical protein|nr:hypothetical protein [Segetibacter sp.]